MKTDIDQTKAGLEQIDTIIYCGAIAALVLGWLLIAWYGL